MRLMLDTHSFLWAVSGDARLGAVAKANMLNADAIFVSVASAWEYSIKRALGKIKLAVDFESEIELARFSKLSVSFAHAQRISGLPAVHGHKDPFDRMLVAQAMSEGLMLVTADERLSGYPVKILDARR